MARKFGLGALLGAACLALGGCNVPADEAGDGGAAKSAGTAKGAAAYARLSPTGGTCGGIAGQQCAAKGDFCAFAEGQCRMPDAQGRCAPRPEMCTQQYDPVCGCDGKTYGNACSAAGAGISVAAPGECPDG